MLIDDIDKLLIHQANNKMDDAILRNLYSLYEQKDIPADVMPMTIAWLGNSSVATLPTLYDLLIKVKMAGPTVGVNVNSLIYKIHEQAKQISILRKLKLL